MNYSAFHWSEKARKYAESVSPETLATKEELNTHIEDTGNPHEVSKVQVGLGNVPNIDATNASNISSGTLNNDRLGTIPYSKLSGVASSAQGAKADSALQGSDVKNNITSTDTDKPLSANMGKELQDQITNLKARGRYLSVWNSTTGLAMTTPVSPLPYDYKAGDYFIVGNITTTGTNYKPNGSQYTGTASTTVETGTVNVNDTYYYDGSSWSLLSGGGQVTATFSSLGGSPYDNTSLSTALNGKQPTLVSGTNIKTINGSTILGSGNISTSELPSQSGQSGKYLTTNGSATSWATVDALPSQSGQNGKFLTTNGTSASWAEVQSHQKTFDILDFKWSDYELNDQNWLNADTFSWQSGTVYSEAYNHLVADLVDSTASIETVGSYSITVYTATDGHKIVLDDMESTVANIFNDYGVAWYYIVDTTNTRFKLPRSTYNKYSKELPAKGNGMTVGITDGTHLSGLSFNSNNNVALGAGSDLYGKSVGTQISANSGLDNRSIGITTDPTKSGIISSSVSDSNMKLYFYVGEFSQSATEQTAGLNAELFNGKVDVDSLVECHTVIETYQNGTEWYRLYDDGWVEQGGIYSNAAVGAHEIPIIVPMISAAELKKSTIVTPMYLSGTIQSQGVSIRNISSDAEWTVSRINCYSWGATINIKWEVKGYAAQ